MFRNLQSTFSYFLKPIDFFQSYQKSNLRPDLIAGVTVAVILLPQAIAYALIVELPPQVGLYTAIIAAMVGALWGSSNHLQTGPTNTLSILLLSTLLTVSTPGTPEFIVLAGMMAVMVGLFQLFMGLARLGVLVNFVSHSVITGFASGAGVLIALKQIRHLLGLEFSSHDLVETIHGISSHIEETHVATMLLGLGTIFLIILSRKIAPKLPGSLIGMVAAAAAVSFFSLDQLGVKVIGQLPRGLPPFSPLPIFNLELISKLSAGAFAVGAIGLVESMSIARSIASQSGQRLDSNQEFVGQGLSNIVTGFFSGYPSAGSFTRSALNFDVGAKTKMASLFTAIFVLIAMFTLGPLAAFVPRTALAGVLIVTAYGMIDRKEIVRIWHGARGDALIMIVTFLGTLFLELEFAVLAGIMLSFAIYIMHTSVPRVVPVLPDDEFFHLIHRPEKADCPQLAIFDVLGDFYFGAVSHVEKSILEHLNKHPEQIYLILRFRSVNQCDMSGIHALESIVHAYRDRGGDVFFVRVQESAMQIMESTGFYDYIGADHFLKDEEAIPHLFYKVLDPAVCIYECEIRAFKECQNLPKRIYPVEIPIQKDAKETEVPMITPEKLWEAMHKEAPPLVIDVREPREYRQRRIPQTILQPLPKLLSDPNNLNDERQVVLVCRSGRRSRRAAQLLINKGHNNIRILKGGITAWEASGLIEAVQEKDTIISNTKIEKQNHSDIP